MKILFLILFVCVALGFSGLENFFKLPDGLLHFYALNVGQGDALLFKGPSGEVALVDGGPDNKVMTELSKILPDNLGVIDLVVLTHPHADHVNGLTDVLKKYKARNVLITEVGYDNKKYREFLELANSQNGWRGVGEKFETKILIANGKFDFKLGSLVFDLIYPLKNIQDKVYKNMNLSSIVMRAIYGEKEFMLTGDMEKEGENELIKSGLDLRADVLKAGHHGSKTSSTTGFLTRVAAKIAVISCGRGNSYGHPNQITLDSFMRAGMRIYRTDKMGTVEIVSDGKKILLVR